MISDCIAFDQIRFFSSFISDYVTQKDELHTLYHHFPSLENFQKQINEKQERFSDESRKNLVVALQEQYAEFEISNSVTKNIALLSQKNTFTVTTGHQLSLFTGPLYFIYKIVSVINTTQILAKRYPDYHFVPVYWMASEDHDFEEINHFHFHNKTLRWDSHQKGMTGRFSTENIRAVYEIFEKNIGFGKNASHLKKMFEKSYLEHADLASATRFLVNALFEKYGVVVVDGNHHLLKKSFVPYMEDDLLQNTAYYEVSETIHQIEKINKIYPIQVNPREINLFYLTQNGRNRIVKNGDTFEILQTNITFGKDEILQELKLYPERFSPNVIMRPLFQEIILPNLAYIGGGGEIAYWLELKRFFETQNMPFPILMLRNSALLVSEKQYKKMSKLNLSFLDLFLKESDLINKKVQTISQFPIDFSSQKDFLKQQFQTLYQIAEKTEASFKNAVKAQEVKQVKGLEQLEKRLIKAQKRNLSHELERIVNLQKELFPNGGLQERFSNFSEFYLEQGETFIPRLVATFDPFDFRFLVLVINNE